jgi:hypothetical protein
VVDVHLEHAAAVESDQGGDEAMGAVEEGHGLETPGAADLQPTAGVCDRKPGDPRRHRVRDAGREPAEPAVAAVAADADHAVPGRRRGEAGQHPRDVGRIVLQVGIEQHDHLARGLRDAGPQGG